MPIAAVLLDIVSIQRFVFATNKLRENEGASYMVETFYRNMLPKVFESLKYTKGKDFLKGFTGGGNALYFLKDEAKAHEFVKNLLIRSITEFPGLKLAASIQRLDSMEELAGIESLEGKTFKEMCRKLHKNLRKNRDISPIMPRLLGHSVTAYDPLSGEPADRAPEKDDKHLFPETLEGKRLPRISQNTYSKRFNAKESRGGGKENYLKKGRFQELLKDRQKFIENREFEFSFPKSLEDFQGERGGKSKIAVIHIDGNKMGHRFMNINSLEMLKKMADSVQKATEDAFCAMLDWLLLEHTRNIIKNESLLADSFNLNKMVPIIPIIMGGDDITFVTDSQLGISLTRIFLESFAVREVADQEKLSACAGIAFVGTKYPFYRAVQLAEALTQSAKQEAHKDINGGSSWLDFQILYGGMSGDLEAMRKKHYCVPQGDLLNGPYMVYTHDKSSSVSERKKLSKLLDGAVYFQNKNVFPKSKLMEFRLALSSGKAKTIVFLNHLHFRGLKFPENIEPVYENVWKNGVTRYFDMIEVASFYPVVLHENAT